MVDIEGLVRNAVKNLKPYKYSEEMKEICEKYGFSPEEIVKLCSNENLFIPRDFSQKILEETLKEVDIRQYPQVMNVDLREKIAEFLKLDGPEQVFVGNGSDELMDIITKIFVDHERKAIIIEPTFDLYTLYVKAMGGEVIPVLLEPDFTLNLEKVLEAIEENKEKTSILFLASPNNPTGLQYPKEHVEKILETFEGIVVLDEAYCEFADYTVLDLFEKFENLIILRTFSKAWGVAGLRTGFAIASPQVTEFMERIVTPFNINIISQAIIPKLLEKYETIKTAAEAVKEEREYVLDRLKAVDGVEVYPSQANFFLMRVTKEGLTGKEIYENLKQKGILVRDRSHLPLCENCLRVTIGTRRMNETFIEALEESLMEYIEV